MKSWLVHRGSLFCSLNRFRIFDFECKVRCMLCNRKESIFLKLRHILQKMIQLNGKSIDINGKCVCIVTIVPFEAMKIS